MKENESKVCFFGSYERETIYSTLKNLLFDKGIKIIECHQDVYSFSQLLKSYFSLLLKRPKEDFSVVIIPWRGIMTLPLAKLIIKKTDMDYLILGNFLISKDGI